MTADKDVHNGRLTCDKCGEDCIKTGDKVLSCKHPDCLRLGGFPFLSLLLRFHLLLTLLLQRRWELRRWWT